MGRSPAGLGVDFACHGGAIKFGVILETVLVFHLDGLQGFDGVKGAVTNLVGVLDRLRVGVNLNSGHFHGLTAQHIGVNTVRGEDAPRGTGVSLGQRDQVRKNPPGQHRI
ncbi:hypothetical protein A9255_20005 [Xenorhabdus hominickii]|uniref:Uncharacterized protein n=1 Tax=Xenorhabdus hominickii TaxID=351679 RepID=A0ABN4SBE6_XENHO|nr:hypothetical protein A9255_20005 [Xenorhabdus hominickii]